MARKGHFVFLRKTGIIELMNISEKAEELSNKLDNLIVRAELWQLLFDECPIAVIVLNIELRFFMVNETFCQLSGYTKSEILGESVGKIIPLGRRKEYKKFEKEFLNNPKTLDHKEAVNTMLTKDSREVLVSAYISPFVYDGKKYHAIFMGEKK